MRAAALVALAIVVLALGGCERAMHDMYRQPRYDRGEPSPLFRDGRADRPPPPGSVPMAMGELAATSSSRRGQQELAAREAAQAATTPRITPALLRRGQERFDIYCLPCHSPVGDGDGPVARRGFPRPPSFHDQRLRDAPDRLFYDVITNGYGVMYSYADRVTPQDRWAIVAYIRALQLSQDAPAAQLPPALREQLAAAPVPAPAPVRAASGGAR
jgi:mono/diheme cytochrome c family protein